MEIGLLINNVGMNAGPHALFLQTEQLPSTVVDVNIASMNAMTRLVLPRMLARKKGAIINLGSLSALLAFPFSTVYASTKAYVIKFTESLAMEYKNSGVIIQCVNPGYVLSNLTKMERPTLTAPTPEVYVKSALRRLGQGGVTSGYWAHDLIAILIHVLPGGVVSGLRNIYRGH
jgi:17beta-estradiol 17-dehydrogenase / very-long-chain 3-oxoacyl-CoA reductase